MGNFDIPDRNSLPEVDEVPINPYRLQKIMEEDEKYNGLSRQSAAFDEKGVPIPPQYWGRNRYRIVVAEGQDSTYGPYPIISIYDLVPGIKDGLLIAKYRPMRAAYKATDGAEVAAVPLQTLEQADRHGRACRLEAERAERMTKKDPRLNASIAIHMPLLMAPEASRKRINVQK